MKIVHLFFAILFTSFCLHCFSQTDTVSHSDTAATNTEAPPQKNDSIPRAELNEKLLEAAEQGKLDDVVTMLIKGADVNAHNYDGVSALMYASQNGFLDIVKILVYNGANINARPYDGTTALLAATIFNRQDVMDYLIQQGASINAKDNDSCTALFYASVYGYFIPADMLIFYGADMKSKAIDSSDALIAASYYGSTDVSQLLIRKGVDINTHDNRGWTPLHCAVFGNHLEIVKMLVDTGAMMDVKNTDGYTPLAIATENGFQQIAEYLLEKKANARIYTNEKAPPLLLSLYNSHNHLSKILKNTVTIKEDWKPFFNNINISICDLDLNTHDFMYGFYAGIHDLKYMLGFRLGYNTRLWANRMLLPVNNNTYYQLWERRSFLYLETEKIFRFDSYGNYQKGVFVALKEIYTYGKYYALEQKPDDKFVISPSVGFVFYDTWGGFRFAYEYCKLDVKDLSPHRLNASVFFSIHIRNLNKTYKNFNWL